MLPDAVGALRCLRAFENIQAKLDLSVALVLAAWPALTLAVRNNWGGANSSEKRDWFAGAVAELLDATPDADAAYLEEFLLQVMNDEFEVNVEDGSGEEVAEKILEHRVLMKEGHFGAVDAMVVEWQQRQQAGADKTQMIAEGKGANQEVDSDEDMSDEEEDDEMHEAPSLIPVGAKEPPPKAEVDQDGFTKVVRKRNR